MKRALLALVVTLALPSLAAPRTYAVHPMEVKTKRDGDQMAAIFVEELQAQDVKVVPTDAVAQALAKQKGKVCPAKGREACLAQLCKKTKADAAVWASFSPDLPLYSVSAVVVSCAGKVEKSIKLKTYEKEKALRLQGVRNVLKLFVADLALAPPPASPTPAVAVAPALGTPEPEAVAVPPSEEVSRPVAPPPPPARATPPPPEKLEPEPASQVAPAVVVEETPPPVRRGSDGGMRAGAYVLGGLGVAGIGAGGVLAILANSEAGALQVDANGNIPVSQLPIRKSADTKSTAALVAVGAGAAVLAAGVAMFFLSDSDAMLGVAPTNGGAAVVFSGTLP